ENQLLTRMPNGTIRFGGDNHSTFNGTNQADKIWAGAGDDTLRGNDGADRIEGGDGNDNLVGGADDDILLDLAGDDVLKGGDGDDALSSGQGFGGDLNMGGRGKDFIVGGNDTAESFAGPDDDFIFAGDGTDTVFGDDGDDWIEDGKGPFSLLQGDNGAPFQDDPNEPGHDVLNGDGGEQDYDAEGGDDVMMAGPGIQRNEGMLGFDWVTHKDDPLPADSDMNVIGALPPGVEVNRDRFDLVESLSGWKFDDVLRGDDRTAADLGTEHQLTAEGIARVAGLAAVLPSGTTSFNAGNIMMGGTGSDLIEGRGGDDFVDGDAWVNARLSVRTDPANPVTQIGTADGMRKPYLAGSTTTLQQAVFAGTVDPGNIVIVREVLSTPNAADEDTVQFTGLRANYTITANGAFVTVVDNVGADGTDTLRNVEALRFSDRTIRFTAPATPVSVAAVAGDSSATVTWTDPASTAVSEVTEHQVQVLVGGAVIRTVTGVSGTASSVVVTGLTNGTAHTFRVVAVNGVGASAPSAESTAVTPAGIPVVSARVPAAGATTVRVGANLTATFDRAVQGVSTSSVVLSNVATGATIPTTVTLSADGRTVTVDPTGSLLAGTQFRLSLFGTVPGGAAGIVSTDGGRLANTSSTFTTVVDIVAPQVSAVQPLVNATGASRVANIRFDATERLAGVTATTFRLQPVLADGSLGAAVPGVVAGTTSGTRWSLNPTNSLAPSTTFQVTLTGGAAEIRDASGNPLIANNGSSTTYTWRFRTRT
ncbi:MAG: Ig-like domain-containing protein, partial [Dermatophilaceae bacterium]